MTDTTNLAGEIRQALEDTTPGPWEWVEDGESMWLENGDGTDVIRADQYEWMHMTQADGELVAAAPELLARAADRIEQLEAENERLRGITFSEVEAEALDEILSKPSQFADRLAETRAAVESRRIAKEGA